MLITFEGLPGAGKTTQTALLADCLRQHGHDVRTVPDLATLPTQPVATTITRLLATTGDPYLRSGDAITDTLLTAAIRADLVATILDPTPTAPTPPILIEDRGIHTMQSYALASLLRDHRAPLDTALAWLHALTTLTGRRPTLALWLRLPTDETIRRASHRNNSNPQPEHRAYLHWVNDAYTEITAGDPHLIAVAADGTPHEVHHAIHQLLGDHRDTAILADPKCVYRPRAATPTT